MIISHLLYILNNYQRRGNSLPIVSLAILSSSLSIGLNSIVSICISVGGRETTRELHSQVCNTHQPTATTNPAPAVTIPKAVDHKAPAKKCRPASGRHFCLPHLPVSTAGFGTLLVAGCRTSSGLFPPSLLIRGYSIYCYYHNM